MYLKTWTALSANVKVLKKHGIAPFLIANQQNWEAQFFWTAYFVNKFGVKTYQELMNRKISWTDKRVVDTFAEMSKLEKDGWFLNGINSLDFDTTAITPWSNGKAAMWYQGFIYPQ